MREPYERIAGGPFRDDTHRAAVEATAVDLARRPPGESQAATSGGKPSQVHSGSNASQRASQRLGPYLTGATVTFQHPRGDKAAVGIIEVMEAARQIVGRIYDDVQVVMASAGPLPLVSTEPWVESDEEYRERLKGWYGGGWSPKTPDSLLYRLGDRASLPRARLVPATTMQGEP